MTELDTFIKTVRDARELKRALAVKGTLAGRPWRKVAAELGVCRAFIGKWRKAYAQAGVEGLRLKYKGSTGPLSAAQRRQVIAWIQKQNRWGIPALRLYLLRTYGVRYKSRQSYRTLLTQAKMSWKKTQKTHPNRDPMLVSETREGIKKTDRGGGAHYLQRRGGFLS